MRETACRALQDATLESATARLRASRTWVSVSALMGSPPPVSRPAVERQVAGHDDGGQLAQIGHDAFGVDRRDDSQGLPSQIVWSNPVQ